MRSRLLPTVVGVGIALGAASCGGRMTAGHEGEEPERDASSGGSAGGGGTAGQVESLGGVPGGGRATGAAGVSSPGTGGVESRGGAPASAAGATGFEGFDPFCDATWPNTKGSPPRPVCVDPKHQCDPTSYLRCAEASAPYQCTWSKFSPYCIDAEWWCPPGTLPELDCKCWGETPAGQRCTESGFVPIEVDGGA